MNHSLTVSLCDLLDHNVVRVEYGPMCSEFFGNVLRFLLTVSLILH